MLRAQAAEACRVCRLKRIKCRGGCPCNFCTQRGLDCVFEKIPEEEKTKQTGKRSPHQVCVPLHFRVWARGRVRGYAACSGLYVP